MTARLRLAVLVATYALVCAPLALAQGTKPAPKTAKPPAKAAPATKKPVTPAVVTPAVPPPPSDVRFKTTYVNGEQTTQSASYVRDQRERYELGDTILIKQPDHKRVVQINVASNTYLVTPDGVAAMATESAPAAAAGVIITNVQIVDMGERKTAFGHEARRVRTVIDRQPQPGACDQSKVRIETDGWYIDPPKALALPSADKTAVQRRLQGRDQEH